MELAGRTIVKNGKLDLGPGEVVYKSEHRDPYTFVVSENIHRRHLTTAQKSELIEALLKANPERSDRATARLAKVSDKTVAATRAKLARAEIPSVPIRRDTRRRQGPPLDQPH
jgi:hypothetical protein